MLTVPVTHHFVLYNEYVVEEKKNNKYMFIIHLFAVYEQKFSSPDHIQYYNDGSTLSDRWNVLWAFRTAALIVLCASSDSYISDWWVELYLTHHIPVTWNSERLYAQTAAASTSVDLWTQFIFSQHMRYPNYQNGSHLWREKETLNKCLCAAHPV